MVEVKQRKQPQHNHRWEEMHKAIKFCSSFSCFQGLVTNGPWQLHSLSPVTWKTGSSSDSAIDEEGDGGGITASIEEKSGQGRQNLLISFVRPSRYCHRSCSAGTPGSQSGEVFHSCHEKSAGALVEPVVSRHPLLFRMRWIRTPFKPRYLHSVFNARSWPITATQ